MQKKTQKIVVTIIIIVISISLIGSSFYAMFTPEPEQNLEAQRQAALEEEYQARKEMVVQLTEAVEKNPENIEAKVVLADAYFDKSIVTGQLNYEEEQGQDLQRAIELYQEVLTQKDDNELMLKLATAAFFQGDTELAEKSYNELLKDDPNNVDALYGYGLLLFYDKQEYGQAEEKWQEALRLTTDEQMKKTLEEMIKVAQGISTNSGDKETQKEGSE